MRAGVNHGHAFPSSFRKDYLRSSFETAFVFVLYCLGAIFALIYAVLANT